MWTFGKRRGGEEIVLCSPPTPLGPPPSPGDSDSEFLLNILITNLEHFPAKIPKHVFSLWLVLSVRE